MPDVLKNIEKMLEKVEAVEYKVIVRVKTPGKGGEPVDGPRLESNTLLIDQETVRRLKAARASIDSEKKSADTDRRKSPPDEPKGSGRRPSASEAKREIRNSVAIASMSPEYRK
jgi:hypothetical protein